MLTLAQNVTGYTADEYFRLLSTCISFKGWKDRQNCDCFQPQALLARLRAKGLRDEHLPFVKRGGDLDKGDTSGRRTSDQHVMAASRQPDAHAHISEP